MGGVVSSYDMSQSPARTEVRPMEIIIALGATQTPRREMLLERI
jgi:hypothetical protein